MKRKSKTSQPLRMADYEGAIVKLNRDLQTVEGTKFKKGQTMICTTTWRGRLNLAKRDGTLGGHTKVEIRQVPRNAVSVVATRLA